MSIKTASSPTIKTSPWPVTGRSHRSLAVAAGALATIGALSLSACGDIGGSQPSGTRQDTQSCSNGRVYESDVIIGTLPCPAPRRYESELVRERATSTVGGHDAGGYRAGHRAW